MKAFVNNLPALEEVCKESEFLTFDSCHVLHSQGEFYAGKTRNSGEIFSNFFDNFYPLTFFKNIVLKTGGKWKTPFWGLLFHKRRF